MNKVIIGLSGKKQSGKNSVCEGLLTRLGNSPHSLGWARMFSFADMLKEKVCIDVMGLTHEQCYGTDEDKNTPTSYRWEQLPREVRYANKLGAEYAPNGEVCRYIYPEGFMTARQVMQVVGTDVFRKYFDDSIWVKATFRSIQKSSGIQVALISDVRFPSEVKGLIENGGYVIRLLRDVCSGDSHSSETSLDDYEWSQHGDHACVIDNREMSMEEQVDAAWEYLDRVEAVFKRA